MIAPFTHAIETIKWEECARLIQNCERRNRHLGVNRVGVIARAVTSRRFYITHQGVAFDPSGQLIDGQHRLAAHANSKTDFIGLVCRYADAAYAEQVMLIFDSGRSRSTADGLAIGGVMPVDSARDMTSVCNALSVLTSVGKDRLDLQETGDFYNKHRRSIQWATSNVPNKRGGAYIRAAFAISWEVNPIKTTELSAQIDAGVGLPGTAAAAWNKAFADGILTGASGSAACRQDTALRALRILKSHLDGEGVPKRIYTEPTSLMWFLAQLGPKIPSETARLSEFETVLLNAIPADGAWLRDICKTVDTQRSTVRNHLARMESVGVVKRLERGFYVAA